MLAPRNYPIDSQAERAWHPKASKIALPGPQARHQKPTRTRPGSKSIPFRGQVRIAGMNVPLAKGGLRAISSGKPIDPAQVGKTVAM